MQMQIASGRDVPDLDQKRPPYQTQSIQSLSGDSCKAFISNAGISTLHTPAAHTLRRSQAALIVLKTL